MLKIGATTILTVMVIPLFAVGYRALDRLTAVEIKIKERKEVLIQIQDDIKEIKTDIKELIRRR